jgi:hypothetical protein
MPKGPVNASPDVLPDDAVLKLTVYQQSRQLKGSIIQDQGPLCVES